MLVLRSVSVVIIGTVSALSLLSQTPPAAPASDAELTLRIIVVGSDEAAQRLRQRLTEGENFVALAKAESLDASADVGGLLGKLRLSTLRPELRAGLEGLKPGQLSRIVRIPTGFAVLQVVSADDGADTATASPAALSATGSVKWVLDVSGLSEAALSLDRFAKPADWNHNPRTICDARNASLDAMRTSLEEFLSPANIPGRAPDRPINTMQIHVGLGQVYAYSGDMAKAIEQFETAYRIAKSEAPDAVLQMEEFLGIAYLHKAELENGIYHSPGDRCLLPMEPGRSFDKTVDSERAVRHLLNYLERKPDEIEVKWLLNLAYMTVGAYPDGVPEKHRIPSTAFASTEDVGHFVDVAADAGLNSVSMAGGLIVDDFYNHGRFDVLTSSFDSCGPLRLFGNNGDGTFTERTSDAGLSGQLGGLNIVPTDYNNDGCLDVLVLRGGWEVAQRKSLLRNNCDGTFTDVTVASGLAVPVTSTQTAVWADIDNDGFLDLFVGNEDSPSQLFRSRRDGTFEDISRAAGVDRVAFTKGVTAADYDNDAYIDLYVSNLNGRNFLYRNNRDATFTELGQGAGVPGPGRGFATWFFDYNNDGWPDLFMTSYFISVEETARTYLGMPHNATTLKLYENAKDGSFREATARARLDKVFMPMGANFGDLDNDGWLDIYLGTGGPSYGSLVPNVLLRNKEGSSFVDVTASSGTGDLHKGHGTAFADLDNDGDEDLVVEMGGATRGDAHALRLFENPGHGNDWIGLKLVGVKTNRPAIGARVKLTVDNGSQTRTIHRTVGSGGSFGASPILQHVGLGRSANIIELEIWWPTSNTRQRFTDVRPNRVLEIQEFSSTYRTLDRPLSRLGRAPSRQRK
jgi:hypothetical protein